MLKPETARSVLNSVVNLVFFLAGLNTVILLWSLLTGNRGTLNASVPVSMSLAIKNQSFEISRVTFIQREPEVWMWVLWLAFIVLLLAVVIFGYGRMKRFINRLLDDPFAVENAADLKLASRIALIFQGVSLLITLQAWWTVHRLQPAAALEGTVKGLPDVQVVRQVFNSTIGGLNILGIDLTPLLVAALLAILATVFQRAHDLREAERALRAEQELTV